MSDHFLLPFITELYPLLVWRGNHCIINLCLRATKNTNLTFHKYLFPRIDTLTIFIKTGSKFASP